MFINIFRYELKGYDKHYRSYWEALGVPSIFVPLIMATAEIMIITEPTDGSDVYIFKRIYGMLIN